MKPVEWLWDPLAYALYVIWLDQTLIAGFAALAASILTVHFVRKQLKQADCHRKDNLSRRHRMLRAGLPASLAEVSQYAEKNARAVWQLRHGNNVTVAPTNLPSEAIRNIQAVIEFADNPSVIALEQLIRYYQIHTSRFRSLRSSQNISKDQTATNFQDAMFLKALCGRLFAYARNESETPDAMESAEWVKRTRPIVLLAFNSGSLPLDDELDEYFEKYWGKLIKKYASFD